MPRAQFRDTVMLRASDGVLGLAPPEASARLCNVGTSTLISDTIYADPDATSVLSNPMAVGSNGELDFWLDVERELDLLVSCPGYADARATVTTDSASTSTGGAVGVDSVLRAYIQRIMSVIDPGGPPPP